MRVLAGHKRAMKVLLTDWKFGYTMAFSSQRACAEYIYFIDGAGERTNTLKAVKSRVNACVKGRTVRIYDRFEVSYIY